MFKPADTFVPSYDAVADINEAKSHCEQWQLNQLSPEEVATWWNAYNDDLDAVPSVLWNTRPELIYTYVYYRFGQRSS